MPSPFPGVDPFIEASDRWVGFHNVLIAQCSKLLNVSLPEDYAAWVDVRRELIPAPGVFRAELEEIPHAFIEIVALPSREIVTSIEILSPSNKNASDGSEYLAKRAAILHKGINLVEIDLLLGGDRLPALDSLPPGDFFAFISRREKRPKADVYGWSIRRTLPTIPIPLMAPDADVALDLAVAYRMTYDGGRYDRSLRYDLLLASSLSEADRQWIGQRLEVRPKQSIR